MEVFKEDMENEEVSLRVNAMHRVRIVATLLGTERIKTQLLFYFECMQAVHLNHSPPEEGR